MFPTCVAVWLYTLQTSAYITHHVVMIGPERNYGDASVTEALCIVSPFGISVHDEPAKHPWWVRSIKVDDYTMVALSKRDLTLHKFLSKKAEYTSSVSNAIQAIKDIVADASALALGSDDSISQTWTNKRKQKTLVDSLSQLQKQSEAKCISIDLPMIVCMERMIGPFTIMAALDVERTSHVKVEACNDMVVWLCAKSQQEACVKIRKRTIHKGHDNMPDSKSPRIEAETESYDQDSPTSVETPSSHCTDVPVVNVDGDADAHESESNCTYSAESLSLQYEASQLDGHDGSV